MALNLYRRHRRDCKAGKPEDSQSSEYEERKKGWKRCECFIVAAGTLAKKFKRQSTRQWEWAPAKEVAAEWEQRGTWDGPTPSVELQPTDPTSIDPPGNRDLGRTKITHATEVFRRDLEIEKAARATKKKYRLLLKRLAKSSDALGYIYLDQWTTLDVRRFIASWTTLGPHTIPRRRNELNCFFNFSVVQGFIQSSPMPPIVRRRKFRDSADKAIQRHPFSDPDLIRQYNACECFVDPQFDHRYTWTGQDVSDFIALSAWTGLRISDVAKFNISRVNFDTGEIHVRTTKTNDAVFTWVPEWLQDRIRARVAKFGPYIFGAPTTDDLDEITEKWRKRLKKVWELCGPVAGKEWLSIQEAASYIGWSKSDVKNLLDSGVLKKYEKPALIDMTASGGPNAFKKADPSKRKRPQIRLDRKTFDAWVAVSDRKGFLTKGDRFEWERKPEPHRFRHTFARILLQQPGVTVRDVSELMGITEEMVRRHYSAWVTDRQERLTNVLKSAFAAQAKPKLIVMKKA